MKNLCSIEGQMITEPIVEFNDSHDKYLSFLISCTRTSGVDDTLKVIAKDSEVSKVLNKIKVMDFISIFGEIRTRTVGRKLSVFIYVSHIEQISEENDRKNIVELEGTICKPVVNRMTPLGRNITDVMLAVNRFKGRSSYIPLVSWGLDATYLSAFKVGDKIHLKGRFQSRAFSKNCETRVAYEVSISEVSRLNDEEKFNNAVKGLFDN